ncbi:MAG: 30S ribosomal protein S17e [Candidatus Thorarchaeota archaeon]|nr:30S ribosomal protein S17e [Candidatus Thorarchaeota archaeon]
MGSIRPGYIKNAARSLLQHYPDEFTVDFETNKRLVEQYTDVESKKVRNRIAGYVVRLVRTRMERETQLAEAEDADYSEEAAE